jgi:hypothetical protein
MQESKYMDRNLNSIPDPDDFEDAHHKVVGTLPWDAHEVNGYARENGFDQESFSIPDELDKEGWRNSPQDRPKGVPIVPKISGRKDSMDFQRHSNVAQPKDLIEKYRDKNVGTKI